MKKALRNLFWIAVALGAIGIISDNCNRAEAHEATGGPLIVDVDDTMRCWQGNCVIYSYNGVISQECDTFCNFYCYDADYKIHCDGQKCWDTHQAFCRIDGGPHPPKNHHGLLDD